MTILGHIHACPTHFLAQKTFVILVLKKGGQIKSFSWPGELQLVLRVKFKATPLARNINNKAQGWGCIALSDGRASQADRPRAAKLCRLGQTSQNKAHAVYERNPGSFPLLAAARSVHPLPSMKGSGDRAPCACFDACNSDRHFFTSLPTMKTSHSRLLLLHSNAPSYVVIISGLLQP